MLGAGSQADVVLDKTLGHLRTPAHVSHRSIVIVRAQFVRGNNLDAASARNLLHSQSASARRDA